MFRGGMYKAGATGGCLLPSWVRSIYLIWLFPLFFGHHIIAHILCPNFVRTYIGPKRHVQAAPPTDVQMLPSVEGYAVATVHLISRRVPRGDVSVLSRRDNIV